jgi:hypothetical protein
MANVTEMIKPLPWTNIRGTMQVAFPDFLLLIQR